MYKLFALWPGVAHIVCTVLEQSSRKNDIIVAGAGPSGLALAGELGRRGLRTLVVDPELTRPWKNSFGGFERDARGLGLSGTESGRYSAPLVWTREGERSALGQAYLRFSSESLKALLLERARAAGVSFSEGVVSRQDAEEFPGLVIDATGRGSLTRRASAAPAFFQSAYGIWIDPAKSPFRSGEMSLMDFRSPEAFGTPSFLYAMVEAETEKRLFVQETVLVSYEPVEFKLLRTRLLHRLERMGIEPGAELGEERCLIPMGLPLPQDDDDVFSFGASAGLVHPATGYQLLRALRLAPSVAEALASGLSVSRREAIGRGNEALWPVSDRQAWQLYRWGAAVIARFGPQAMRDFIQAFFAMPSADWLGFMTGTLSPSAVLGVMWRVFLKAPLNLQVELLKVSSRCGVGAASTALSS